MKRMQLFQRLVAGLVLAGLAVTNAFAARDSMNVAAYTKFHTMEPYQTSARQMIQMAYLMFDPLVLREPATGIAKGQAAVFYQGDQVLGGGWIKGPLDLDASENPLNCSATTANAAR